MEEKPLYDQISGSGTATTKKIGKLKDPAFKASLHLANIDKGWNGTATTANPLNLYNWETKIPVLQCPSYAGEDTVAATTIFPAATTANGVVAACNYIVLASTHYLAAGDLATGPPVATAYGATATNGCGQLASLKAYCGNGGIPFPGGTGSAATLQLTRKGFPFASFTDGTSKTILITETRDENYTSWYSGFTSYGVGAWPQAMSNATEPKGSVANGTAPIVWTLANGGDSSINKGDRNTANTTRFYQATNPHKTGTNPWRKWGPSSLHPGVVQAGWGDGRGAVLADNVDPDVFLALITRNGRETASLP
jgi:hypothetical protein